MSFTPTAGVPMSTRSGDLDPGLLWYLTRTEKLSAKQFNEMVNFHSGLLGVSETSSDMRDLLEHEMQDVRAAEAVALFCLSTQETDWLFRSGIGWTRHVGVRWRYRKECAPSPRPDLRWAGIPWNRTRGKAKRGE
jgi:hypothetical protein